MSIPARGHGKGLADTEDQEDRRGAHDRDLVVDRVERVTGDGGEHRIEDHDRDGNVEERQGKRLLESTARTVDPFPGRAGRSGHAAASSISPTIRRTMSVFVTSPVRTTA